MKKVPKWPAWVMAAIFGFVAWSGDENVLNIIVFAFVGLVFVTIAQWMERVLETLIKILAALENEPI